MFKNVTTFALSADQPDVDLVALEAAAGEHASHQPEPSQGYTIGFAPALFGRSPTRVHVADGGNLAMATVRIYEKKVPGALWTEETDRRVDEFQRIEGKPPSKEDRDALKSDAYAALLTRAFPKTKVINVLFVRDQRLVLVGSASNDDVDSVTRLLRTALGTFSARPLRNSHQTESTLTMWVKNKRAPHDREAGVGFFLGEAATMSRSAIRGEGPAPVAMVKNSDLSHEDVQEHLNCGKRVQKLAFACRLSDQFTVYGSVDKEFVLRGLQVGASEDARDADGYDDESAYYAGQFLLEAKPLAQLVKSLRDHLVQDIEEPAGDLLADK